MMVLLGKKRKFFKGINFFKGSYMNNKQLIKDFYFEYLGFYYDGLEAANDDYFDDYYNDERSIYDLAA